MKIPNKRELQQTAFNHLSDIDFQDFMDLHKKCTTKPSPFLVIDPTIVSDNPSRFGKDFLERLQKLTMKIDDKIKNEKLKYFVNRKSAKMSSLSSGKIDKYEFLTEEKILPSIQRQIIKQAKFAYSPLGKTFEKQTEKQVGAIKSPEPSNKLK